MSKGWGGSGEREEQALHFTVGTEELGARAHGQALGAVTTLDGIEIVWTLASESSTSFFDEAEMRTATIVCTTGISH